MKRLSLVLTAVLAITATVHGSGQNTAVSKELNVRVQQTANSLLITNNGPAEIGGYYLTVNSRFKRIGLKFPVGTAVEIKASSLMTGNDVRLDLSRDEVERVHLDCSEPENADSTFKTR